MSEYEHTYEEAAAYLLQRTSARPVGALLYKHKYKYILRFKKSFQINKIIEFTSSRYYLRLRFIWSEQESGAK